MKIKQNRWFWGLQLMGWGSIAGLGIWTKLEFAKDLDSTYIVLEGLLILLSGIIISALLRNYFKKTVLFNEIQSTNYAKVFIAIAIAILLFAATLFIAKPLSDYYNTKALEINGTFVASQLINSTVFFLIWSVLYFGIKITQNFNNNKLEQSRLKTALRDSQLNTLKGQINPHFMFNSLNNIRGLMLEDVDKSREMITRLSDMLRYSLTKNSLDKIALTEELEMVDNYIELSKIQLEDRLNFTKEIDENIKSTEIPPMLVQMLIENAIKHGISNLPKGGEVVLTIKKEAQNLIIEVKNTGKLANNKTSTKVGLANIKKRLSLMYGDNADFSLKEEDNNVVAIIIIPM